MPCSWRSLRLCGEKFSMERFRGLICCFAVFLLFCFSASAFAQPAPSDPSHQQFLFAYKLLQRGENQLAVEAFDEYLTKFPDAAKRGDAMYFSAMLYRRLGQPAKALAKLADAPFIKVEATKFTEVGFVGKDVDSIIKDLVEVGLTMARTKAMAKVKEVTNNQYEDQMEKKKVVRVGQWCA